ncbi:hypothetical protein LCGC14_1272270 [marine sediment metagenome]|uniref:Uncharacterized protein n=1 Tax=marine sediment metagenome TaxID=412755 RepID=A0A0F9KXS8_9ZZZZ
MARNRIIYGSQSVWVNGEIMYRVQTLGSTTTFTSEDIFELGHLDIVDIVDDVPAVAVTLNTNDWGDVKTMSVLAQVASAKLVMTASPAANGTANLATVSGASATEKYYHHGVSIPDFAITCGNLPGVSMWAPVQSECDLGTLADSIDQTMFMDEVFVNSLEFGYTTGANATENYGAETDQKMWLLNDGRFVNWEELDFTNGDFTAASGTLASGVTIATFSDGNLGFLRLDVNGARGVTYHDASNVGDEVLNYAVTAGSTAIAGGFVYREADDQLLLPTDLAAPAAGDKIFAVYAGDGYTAGTVSNYFDILEIRIASDGSANDIAIDIGQHVIQKYQVRPELDQFWATIIGPAEYLRSKLRECLYGLVKDWKQIIFDDNEAITILYKDGTVKSYESPYKNSDAT